MTLEFTADITSVPDDFYKYAIIVSRCQGQWVFVRHKDRPTFEIPAGHREPGEKIEDTADRELREETGATEFNLWPVCAFRIPQYDDLGERIDTVASLLCYAEISCLGPLASDIEIAEVILADSLPENLTYPEIQPRLFEHVVRMTQ